MSKLNKKKTTQQQQLITACLLAAKLKLKKLFDNLSTLDAVPFIGILCKLHQDKKCPLIY